MGELALKTEIRGELPAEAFRPQPIVGWLGLILIFIIVFLSWSIVHYHPRWYIALVLSLILGQMYSTLMFLGHEILHGSVFRSKWAQDIFGYFALLPFCFSPSLWRVWHNQLHHGYTNIDTIEPLDPDAVKHIEVYKRNLKRPMIWRMLRIIPGSLHWTSYLYPFFGLTMQSVAVLWVLSKIHPDHYKNINRRRAQIEQILIVSFWIAFSILVGIRSALFIFIIPFLTANFIEISYIMTNHFLRPTISEDNPLKHSMSIDANRWIDLAHLRFSHHVEHHFFPRMSFRYTPLVRKYLKENYPEDYLAPRHWNAIKMVYKRPTFFKDANTFINPGENDTMTVWEIERALRYLD